MCLFKIVFLKVDAWSIKKKKSKLKSVLQKKTQLLGLHYIMHMFGMMLV